MVHRVIILFVFAVLTIPGDAETRLHRWPFAPQQAVSSDKYEVYVSIGDAPEIRLDVVMSNAIHEGDWRATELQGRTFSFAALDYDPVDGPLQFRVVKTFGAAATSVEVQPRSYAVTPALSTNGTQATFAIAEHSRYLSVHFRSVDNETAPNQWIKHMLAVFIDPPETGRPDPAAAGVVTFGPTTTATQLTSAATIRFPPGYHNLRSFPADAPLTDGILTLAHAQRVYLESGAFVDGLIATSNTQTDRNQRIHGRGILSGRLHPWYNKPGYTGPRYQQIVRLGQDATIDGVTIMESPSHGIVGGNRTTIRYMKMLGWHSNNGYTTACSGPRTTARFSPTVGAVTAWRPCTTPDPRSLRISTSSTPSGSAWETTTASSQLRLVSTTSPGAMAARPSPCCEISAWTARSTVS
jgi:hypothetical protein